MKRPRLPFLDWVRGLAAVVMLQGHAYHAFARDDLRNSGPYVFSQFFGGLPPAIFLFLTGITFAFSMDRADRSGRDWKFRWLNAVKRSRYLISIAVLFRIQLWVFAGGQSPWTDLLKVDVLNCMAATMLLLGPLALLEKEYRIRGAAIAGIAIASLSPLVSLANLSWMPWPLRDYLAPNFNFFSLFPWAAFLAFGVAAGTILKSVTADQMHRLMLWTTLMGFVMVTASQYISNLPYNVYPASDFWLNSPWLVLIKLGCVLVLIGGAFLWTEHVVQERWSWIKQIGTTSLLVYWVHIELVYGRWFADWKNRLDNYQLAAFSLLLIAAMLGLSVLKAKWREFPLPSWIPVPAPPAPRRVPGD